MSVKVSTLVLTSNRFFCGSPEKVRGNIASRHLDNPLFHQHLQNNKLAYRYPLIHYLILNGKIVIFGLQAGADEVSKLFNEIEEITVGTENYHILDKQLSIKNHLFRITDSPKQYSFITPWLALNADNYLKYQKANWTTRRQLLSQILTGNILSAAKGLGIKIDQKLFTEIGFLKPVNCQIKGNPLMGFFGQFKINFDIPSLFSIGKSVSRGFGVILEEEKCSLS